MRYFNLEFLFRITGKSDSPRNINFLQITVLNDALTEEDLVDELCAS